LLEIRLNEHIQPISLMKDESVPCSFSYQQSFNIKSVLQFCVGNLMLCMNCFSNNRNCGYYEKKV
jgi:hypothetical protein